MKRRDLIRILEDAGYKFLREGGNHSLYYHPKTGQMEPVAHGREIPEGTAKEIIKRVQRRR